MPTGEPTTMSSGEPAAAMTTAEPTTAVTTPTREGINRGKSDCSTDDGGDGNSDDLFF